MKKTWKIINETLGRDKKEQKLPTSILHNNNTLREPMHIASAFNDYFANIGTDLVSAINYNDNNDNYT